MIEVKLFKIEHLDSFEPKDQFEDIYRDMKLNLLNPNMTILSLMVGDKCVAIEGVTKYRTGVGELWLLPSVHVDSMKLNFFKTTKWLIYSIAFEQLRFHRLELAILKGWHKGYKWARKLGFEYSHVCDAYDNLYQDHVIYKKVVR